MLDVLFFGKSYSIVCGDFSHALQKKKAFSKNKNILFFLYNYLITLAKYFLIKANILALMQVPSSVQWQKQTKTAV